MMIADLRYAIRALSANRWFTAAAVLTLALGIGANTAIFSVLYGVLLKPLPYADASRLIRIAEGRPGMSLNVSYPNFIDWRARNHVFSDMAIFNTLGSVVLPAQSTTADVYPSGTCEARIFSVLGVQAARGRVFTTAEEKPDTPVVAVVSDRVWRSAFGGDPGVVGRAVRMDEDLVTIVGVLPPGLRPFNVDVWFPMRHLSAMQLDRANHPGFAVIARLRDGIELTAARGEMDAIAQSLAREYPSSNRDMGVTLTPLLDSVTQSVRPALTTLMAAVCVLLLIACANVANLLLAKGLRRERETSIRGALGASRARLARLFLIEGLTLGISGATAGLLLAAWSVRLLRAVPGLVLPRLADIAVDPAVLAFALALGIVTALLFGFAPAIHLSRVDLMRMLRLGSSADTTTPATSRLRSGLVLLEVALLLVLLAGAGLMQRTLGNLAAINPGFDADRILAVRMQPPSSRYQDEGAIRTFADRVGEAVRQNPAVAGAAIVWPFDYTGFAWSPFITLTDRPFQSGREPSAQAAAVTPEYFATLGIPLLRGRNFGPEDRPGSPVGVIVSQTFVDRFLSGEDPIGKRVSALRIPQLQAMPIIGVVGDTRRGGMLKGFFPEMYVAYSQFPVAGATVVVRANGVVDPLALGNDAKVRIAGVDPAVAVLGVKRVGDALANSYSDRQTLSWLLSTFAVLALALTVLGIASVVSFSVAQRTTEIGVRMALGADRASVVRLMVRGIMMPVCGGVAAGLVVLVPSTRMLRAYLYGVGIADPLTLAAAVALLLGAALAAAYVPARRAASVDPLTALKA
jgi:putative ABC transport system permease protein